MSETKCTLEQMSGTNYTLEQMGEMYKQGIYPKLTCLGHVVAAFKVAAKASLHEPEDTAGYTLTEVAALYAAHLSTGWSLLDKDGNKLPMSTALLRSFYEDVKRHTLKHSDEANPR